MTVKELIEQLSKLEQNKEIYVLNGQGFDDTITFVGKERDQKFWLDVTFEEDDNQLTNYVIR